MPSEDEFVESVLAKVHGWLTEEDTLQRASSRREPGRIGGKPHRSDSIERIKALQRRLSRGDPFYEPVERGRSE